MHIHSVRLSLSMTENLGFGREVGGANEEPAAQAETHHAHLQFHPRAPAPSTPVFWVNVYREHDEHASPRSGRRETFLIWRL